MKDWMKAALAACALCASSAGCSGSTGAAPHLAGATEGSLEDCMADSRSYAEPGFAPCAAPLREAPGELAARWATFTPYERFFLRQVVAPAALPAGPDDASAEACAAVATAPVHWLGAPVVSATPLASTLLAVPNLEGCLLPLVHDETRESFLDDGEGNAVAQGSRLTRGDVAAWFVAQLRRETFSLGEPSRAEHRERLGRPAEPPPTAPPVSPPASLPASDLDDRLRAACVPRDVRRHLRALHAAAPAELDASCANPDFASFSAWMDAYEGPSVSRSGACIEDRCLLRLESVTARHVSALHVWYTRGSDDSARLVRCEALRGG